MQPTYAIKFDHEKDATNWYEVTRDHSFQGFNWRDCLERSEDIQLFDTIASLPDDQAMACARQKLKEYYKTHRVRIAAFKTWMQQEFDQKFMAACNCLEKITQKPLAIKKYTFLITTFPRCPYFCDCGKQEGGTYFYVTTPDSGDDLITDFLHEALHFQFHAYWQHNPKSKVSKLSANQFDFLKESLTVIIDDELKPLISGADRGYPNHQAFRKLLHQKWAETHDFERLVLYGLANLKTFCPQ